MKILESYPTEVLHSKHVNYLKSWGTDEKNYEFAMSEHLRMSGMYWCLTALDLLHGLSCMIMKRDDIIQFILDCHHPDGGFAPCRGHDPHILSTLSAIQVCTKKNSL